MQRECCRLKHSEDDYSKQDIELCCFTVPCPTVAQDHPFAVDYDVEVVAQAPKFENSLTSLQAESEPPVQTPRRIINDLLSGKSLLHLWLPPFVPVLLTQSPRRESSASFQWMAIR